jgi:hypothetical protein
LRPILAQNSKVNNVAPTGKPSGENETMTTHNDVLLRFFLQMPLDIAGPKPIAQESERAEAVSTTKSRLLECS